MAAPATQSEKLHGANGALTAGPSVAVEPVRIPGQPSRLQRYESTLIGILSVVAFLVVWHTVTAARLVPALFLPGPFDTLNAFVGLVKGGSLWNDLWVSGQEMIYGYVLAIVIGMPLGLLMGWYRRLSFALDPFVAFFYSMPRVALIPLLIIWFGIGIYSKVAVVFLGAIFPIVINTMAGVRNLDANWVKAARSFGASDSQIFRTVALPGSVPFILTGLRLGIGHALVGVVVGELVAAQAGIGLMMATAGSTFQTPKVFAGLILLSSAGLGMTYLLQSIERRYQAWRPD
ncbi:MAG TPA: ABC transporter permease [Chloroflexota bacterium]|nr:ABC transporter permease [Chloroflexota bacterium]